MVFGLQDRGEPKMKGFKQRVVSLIERRSDSPTPHLVLLPLHEAADLLSMNSFQELETPIASPRTKKTAPLEMRRRHLVQLPPLSRQEAHSPRAPQTRVLLLRRLLPLMTLETSHYLQERMARQGAVKVVQSTLRLKEHPVQLHLMDLSYLHSQAMVEGWVAQGVQEARAHLPELAMVLYQG